MRGNRGKMAERPFDALYLPLRRDANLDQMTNRGRQHVGIAFEVVVVLRKASQHACDIRGHRGFFRNDERRTHGDRRRRAFGHCPRWLARSGGSGTNVSSWSVSWNEELRVGRAR